MLEVYAHTHISTGAVIHNPESEPMLRRNPRRESTRGKVCGRKEQSGRNAGAFGISNIQKEGNALTSCVNKAISTLRTNGTLKKLQQLWLAKATGAPILK